ncbi:toll/interleukin-1 receptor domain-containing protein [Rhodopirellula baltica]
MTELNDEQTGQLGDRLERIADRSVWKRLTDRFYGYDYFVSYRWSDGRGYAVSLCEQLEDKGFDCFLDSSEFGAGVNHREVGDASLRKTTRLVLVGSPEVHQSEAVHRELRVFRETGKSIIPINFGDSLTNFSSTSPLLKYLDPDSIWIPEPVSALQKGPSQHTIEKLVSSFNLERNDARRTRFFQRAGIVGSLLLLMAAGSLLRLWWNLPGKRTAEALARLRASGFVIEQQKDASGSPHFEVAIREAPAHLTSLVQDFRTLEKYNEVVSVDTNMSLIGNLAPFEPLVNLQKLYVGGSNLQDLDALSSMTRLNTLVLAQNRQLNDDDLRVLKELRELRSLELDGCGEITNQALGYLAGLPLRRLWLNSCRLIDNEGLDWLRKLPLTELRLKNTSVVIDDSLIDLIDQLPLLRTLSISPQGADPQALQDLKARFSGDGYHLDAAPPNTGF